MRGIPLAVVLAAQCTAVDLRLYIPDFETASIRGARSYDIGGDRIAGTADDARVGQAEWDEVGRYGSNIWVVVEETFEDGTPFRTRLVAAVPVAGSPGARILRFPGLPAGGRLCYVTTFNEAGESPPSIETYPC